MFSRHSVEVKRQMAWCRGNGVVGADLTGAVSAVCGENVRAGSRDNGKAREELLEFMQLADREKTLIADYSHGMQKN